MPNPIPKESESLAWVDALRGIAILGVMLVHCCHVFSSLPPVQWVLSGQYGVQLFFIASAFTLARSWHRRRAECHPMRNYLLRRWFRIAPLYVAGVLTYTLLAKMDMGVFPAHNYTLKAVGANLAFLHGWLPFAQNGVMPGGWSIGVEMSFYLLVPWLAVHLRRPLAALLAFAASIPLAWGCAWIAYKSPSSGLVSTHSGGFIWPVTNNSFLYYWLPTQIPVFIMGFFAYGILDRLKPMLVIEKRRHTASLLFLGSSLLVFWLVSLGMGKQIPSPVWLPAKLAPHFFLLAPSLAGIASCLLLLALSLTPWRLLVNKATVFLGKLSYSLYIVHFIGAWLIAPWVRVRFLSTHNQPWETVFSFLLSVLVCLAFAIPVAMLTHRFIEKPGIELGKKLIKRLENPGNQTQQTA